MHHHRYAATLLATVIGLMGGIASAQPSTDAAKPMAKPSAKPMTHNHAGMGMHHDTMSSWCDCGWRKNWAFDGIYGPHTMEGVMEFQRHHGLRVDGIAGPATQRKLGMRYVETLKQGSTGAQVRMLQHALAHHAMMMMKPTTKPTPKPSAKPSPKPTHKPSAMPTEAPTPMPTPMPTEMPTPAPTPMATPTPQPSPSEEAAPEVYRPTLELRGGDWMLPTTPGGNNYNFGLNGAVWNGDASLWFGDFGIGGGVTMFPSFSATTGAAPVGPVYMYNGDLKWRGPKGQFAGLLGYRGMNTQGLNFGEVGFTWDVPLGMDWLLLQVHPTVGYNFSNAYFADGLAGLELRFGPVGLDGGWRALYLNAAGASNTWMGPQASLHLAF